MKKDEILDTGGGVLNALKHFSNEPFIGVKFSLNLTSDDENAITSFSASIIPCVVDGVSASPTKSECETLQLPGR